MADFSFLGEAVYRASGKAEGAFLSDYSRNRSEGVHRTIDSSPVASKLIELLEVSWNQEFRGTIGSLYEELNGRTHPEEAWPKSSRGFGSSLRRLAPSMRVLGYEVEIDDKRSNDGYRCVIRKVQEPHQSLTTNDHEQEQNESTFIQYEKNHEPELEYEEF